MAVDDAYSRYVMTLEPMKYMRFRDVAVGNTVATDEVYQGGNTAAYSRTLVSNDVGAAALPPGLAGGATCLKFGYSNLRLFLGGPYTLYPHTGYMTANYWYKNPTDPGAVNKRLLNMITGNESASGYRHALCLFSWNSIDNGLCEIPFRNPNALIGAGVYDPNPGGSVYYRYMAYPAGVAVGTVTMLTARINLLDNTMALFKNGVKQFEFTWPFGVYRPMQAAHGNNYQWLLGSGYNGTSYYDYSTAEVSEFSLHNRPLTDEEILDLYTLGTTGHLPRVFEGTVTDILGNPLARMVRAHKITNGDLLWETTSSAIDGSFSSYSPSAYKGEVYVLAFDDLGVAPDYNAAIHAGVVPTQ